MRARVAAGTDGVSVLLSTIETAACETPAAIAMSFCVGRTAVRLSRLPSRDCLVYAILITSYTFHKTRNKQSRRIRRRWVGEDATMPWSRRQVVAAIPAASLAAVLPREKAIAQDGRKDVTFLFALANSAGQVRALAEFPGKFKGTERSLPALLNTGVFGEKF